MNFIIGFVLLGLCVFAGYRVASSYRRKLNFVNDFKNLLNFLETNIMFTQDNLNKILTEKKDTFHKDFQEFLAKYLDYQQDCQNVLDEWKKEQNVVDSDTAEVVVNFMIGLGRNDSESQIQSIKQAKEILNGHIEKVTKEQQSKGAMSMKLGIMGGLALIIIVL